MIENKNENISNNLKSNQKNNNINSSRKMDMSMSKISPNNVEEASPNERNSDKIKFADGNDMLNSKPTISRDNLMDPKDNMKYSSTTYYNHMTMGDVKKN